MTDTVKIKKLTPPQIAAIREAYPGLVKVGVISTTNSIATFAPVNLLGRGGHKPETIETLVRPWSAKRVHDLLFHRWQEGMQLDSRLEAVLRKLEARPDLVEEV